MSEQLALLRALVEGRTDRNEEEMLLDLFTSCTTEALNDLLTEVDPAEILDSLDNRLLGPDNRDRLIALLGQTRGDELTRTVRARVLHGLGAVRRSPARDAAVADLLVAVTGADLTRLKNELNRHQHHDLEDLVFTQLGDGEQRTRVLAHIAAQAETVDVPDAKVLSDIDDTAFCRLNDRRYPRHTVYPGVLALYEALDIGPGEPFDTGDLTFVTARPADALGLVESHSRAALRQAGISNLSVMSGSLMHLHSNEVIAQRKMENIDHYRLLFPEYGLVLVGDSGQGDILVGQRMYAHHGPAVRLVLIHDVVDTPAERREAYAEEGIHLVDTYVGAALVAYRQGLISARGLDHVATEAVAGFEAIRWDDAAQRTRMRDLFERDLDAVVSAI